MYVLRFLSSKFRCVVNVVFFLLDDSSASEFYIPTFRNTLFHLHISCEQEVPGNLLGHKTYEDGTDSVLKGRQIKLIRRDITQN